MDKILNTTFIDANEKYAASVTLYAKETSDGYVYADAGYTINVDHDTLLNLCLKQLVVVLYKGAYYHPVYFKDSDGTVTVTVATAITGTAAVLDLKSKEPTEG